jgi:hypothetical protein
MSYLPQGLFFKEHWQSSSSGRKQKGGEVLLAAKAHNRGCRPHVQNPVLLRFSLRTGGEIAAEHRFSIEQ